MSFDLFSTKPVDVTNTLSLKTSTPKAAKVAKEQVNILVQAGATVKFPQSIINLLGLNAGNNFHIAIFGATLENPNGELFITTIPSNIKETYSKVRYTGRPVNDEGKFTHKLIHEQLGGQYSEWNLELDEEGVAKGQVGPNINALDYSASKAANPAEIGPDVISENATATWYHLVQVKDGAITRANLAKEVGTEFLVEGSATNEDITALGFNPDVEATPEVLAQVVEQLVEEEAPITEEEAAEYDAQATAWAEEQAERDQYLRDLAAEQEQNAILAGSPFDNESGSNN